MRSGIITIISAHFANVRLRLLHRFSLSRSLSPRLPLDVRGSNCDRASFPFHCKMLPWNCQVSIILCMRAAIFMVHSSAPRTSFIASGLAKNFFYIISLLAFLAINNLLRLQRLQEQTRFLDTRVVNRGSTRRKRMRRRYNRTTMASKASEIAPARQIKVCEAFYVAAWAFFVSLFCDEEDWNLLLSDDA